MISRTANLDTHTIPDHGNGEEFVTDNTEMQVTPVKVELNQCSLKIDNDTNRDGLVSRAHFSEEQYRFSRVHNAVKTATFPALDHSNVNKLVTFQKNAVQPHTENTEMFWSQIEIFIGFGFNKVAIGVFPTMEN